jgi:hypothetical protein
VGGRRRREGLARVGVRRSSSGGEPDVDVEEGHAEVGGDGPAAAQLETGGGGAAGDVWIGRAR